MITRPDLYLMALDVVQWDETINTIIIKYDLSSDEIELLNEYIEEIENSNNMENYEK